MRTILYMAISLNGLIAREDGNVDWISEDGWFKGYLKLLKRTGNLIVGSNTYAVMPPEEFLEDVLYVVLTKKSLKNKAPNVIFTSRSPKGIIRMLKDKGFKEICIGGGAMINSSFVKEGLVDEIILDVEPIVFGKGLQLFYPQDFEYNLELLGVKNLNKNTIQLHYKVRK